uniref:Trichodiene synthase n=1 Tax=Streptomyces sp. NBC_00180 TaxID=2903632 RepID=A0AAU1IAF5_9ACTN
MNQASRLMVRPPRPPGVDTLHYTPRSGLEAIREPGHRRMVASVLASGLVDRMIALTEGFEPPVDIQQAHVDSEQLAAEFAAYGVTVPAATTRHITLMRALMVPIADDALALALDRIWVFTTHTDDVCCHDPAEAEAIMRAGMLTAPPGSLPNTRFIQYMFNEIAPFCDPTFLAVYRTFFYQAITGVLMEAEFTPQTSDDVDSDYVRIFNGFSQFWFTSLQFTDPCLDACSQRAFWSAALSPCVTFLNDINDVLSFYKEAVHGGDFVAGRIYRRSVKENVPYLAVYREILESGLTAYRRVPALADDEQRRHLDRYMQAFIHWHFRSPRYGWQKIYPGLTPIRV